MKLLKVTTITMLTTGVILGTYAEATNAALSFRQIQKVCDQQGNRNGIIDTGLERRCVFRLRRSQPRRRPLVGPEPASTNTNTVLIFGVLGLGIFGVLGLMWLLRKGRKQ